MSSIARNDSKLHLLVISDLHVDYPRNRERLPDLARHMLSHSADALIVAGDVSHRLKQVESTLAAFAGFPGPKLFVAGNHDVWIVRPGEENAVDSWDKLRALAQVCARTGFVNLEEENARAAGFTFVGTMAWYDYSFADPRLGLSAADYARKRWRDLTYMDGAYARWNASDAEVARRLEAGVRERLAQAKPPIVFVSHHVPLEELVLRRGDASWDYFNAFMGTRSLESRLRERGASRFVFGHTHRPVSLIEGDRFVLNNPLGYPRQSLSPRLEPFVVG